MSWREKLLPASFRDVPFAVSATDDTVGRRTVVHEYPARDVPYVEDMGEVTRKISISAFCVGDDYLDQRDALQTALNKVGSGTLVHPYYGKILVALSAPVTIQHTAESGGMCVFSLEFVRVEERKDAFSSASVNNSAKVQSLSSSLLSKIGDTLTLAVAAYEFGDWVKDNVQEFASNIISELAFRMGVSDLASDFAKLFYNDEANVGTNYVGALEGVFSGQDSVKISSVTSSYSPSVVMPERMGTSIRAVKESQKAFLDATKQVEYVVILQSFTTYTPKTRQEGTGLSDYVVHLYDDIMLNYCSDDEILQDMADLRIYALRVLFDIMGKVPYIKTVNLLEPSPALQTSYFYLGDLSAEDMAEKNDVEHPGFIPANAPIEIKMGV